MKSTARHLDAKCSAGVDAGEQLTVGGQTYPLPNPFLVLEPNRSNTKALIPCRNATRRFMLRFGWITRHEIRKLPLPSGLHRLCLRDRAGAAVEELLSMQDLVRKSGGEHVYDSQWILVRKSRPTTEKNDGFISQMVSWGWA